MTSEDFKKVQNLLETVLIKEVNDSMRDYEMVRSLVEAVELVDFHRRQAWHKEKFGVYEEIADDICADDIPF